MTKYTRGTPLTAAEIELYKKSFDGLTPTGETIVKEGDDCRITKVVFKGRWTPYGAIRDCGGYYIEAGYSAYRRISKDLSTVVDDVDAR